jgi:hypothetical protein
LLAIFFAFFAYAFSQLRGRFMSFSIVFAAMLPLMLVRFCFPFYMLFCISILTFQLFFDFLFDYFRRFFSTPLISVFMPLIDIFAGFLSRLRFSLSCASPSCRQPAPPRSLFISPLFRADFFDIFDADTS